MFGGIYFCSDCKRQVHKVMFLPGGGVRCEEDIAIDYCTNQKLRGIIRDRELHKNCDPDEHKSIPGICGNIISSGVMKKP